jgi:hypothetical protein
MSAPAFVCLEGRWYVQPFEQRPTRDQLVTTLGDLLQRHPPLDILVLRRMSSNEVRLLKEHRRDCDAEILSVVLAPDEAR